MYILTPDEVRAQENKAFSAGLSYKEMMLNAGNGCAERIASACGERRNTVILCGKGKNGGDGFVIAAALFGKGFKVTVIRMFDSPSDPLSEEMFSALPSGVKVITLPENSDAAYEALQKAEIVADAVFGIGFKGSLPEHIAAFFDAVNRCGALRFAVDIPSGLSFPNEISGHVFKADFTLSMLCYKKEHIYKPWSFLCGETVIIPIGFPVQGDFPSARTDKEIRDMLPPRPYDGHKGIFGHALILAGSRGMPGAAVIAAKGALNTGAGLVTLGFPDCCYPAVTAHLTESVLLPLLTADDGSISEKNTEALRQLLPNYGVIAAGCGLSVTENTEKLVGFLIRNHKGTLILDADGINLVSLNIHILKEAAGNIVLTPHPAEMARLLGTSPVQVNADRENTALAFSREFNVTVLLKGHNTVVASPDGRLFINRTGSSALSRGGSGDLLTGMLAAFAAQGAKPFESACLASFVHGLSGETAERKYTSYSSTVERITDCIPDALSHILESS